MIKNRLILVPLFCLSAALQAAPYTIVDLGALTEEASFGTGVNANGLAVGQFDGPRDTDGAKIFSFHGFSFDGSNFVDLGSLESALEQASSVALDVNDNGQIVGFSDVNISTDPDTVSFIRQAFIYENGVMTALGLPASIDSNESRAISINNLGIISGFAKTVRDPDEDPLAYFEQAAIIDPNAVGDKFTLLGSLVPDGIDITEVSSARASNSNGQIVGWSTTEDNGNVSFTHAFYIDPLATNEMIDLATFGGNESSSADINELGLVVGRSQLEDSSVMAFKFDIANDSEIVALGTLTTDFPGSAANAVNDNNQIVGFSISGPFADPALPIEPKHAVLFENDTIIDLNSQIDCPLGWVLVVAKDINNAGQIVGSGSLNGETHGFLLTPNPGGGAAEACIDPVDPGDDNSSGGSLGFGFLILLFTISFRSYRLRLF